MGFESRKKGKYEGVEKFIKKIKEIQEEAKAVLGKALKEAKGTISLVQAKDVVPGPNCMLKSLWG